MTDLFTKITMGGQELQNRMVLAPMTRARCEEGTTLPSDLHVQYYTQRATCGLVITEGTEISEQGYGWHSSPMISTSEHATAWKKVTDSVHEKGAKIYCQIWHMGRNAHSSFHPGKDMIAPSAIKVGSGHAKNSKNENVEHEVPREMTTEDIKQVISEFVNAARMSKEAGFDGVEIHSANGYLIDTFFQSSTNTRTDNYGGSMENRVRILTEIIDAIVADGCYPAERIGCRLSPNGTYGDMGSEDNHIMFPFIAKTLSTYGIAYLHVMEGLGFGFHEKCPVVTAFDIKKEFGGTVLVNVGLTKDTANGMLRSGAADMAVFGRLYISNPDLPERFKNDWPLNEDAPYPTWWGQGMGEKGYIDWPTYKPSE